MGLFDNHPKKIVIKNDNKMLISIVLPIFNGQEYLAQTIEMVLASYYTNIELICVDDGSNDESASICMQFVARDNRVKFYKRKINGGVAECRNTGLKFCRGDYICFVDQDDIIEPNFYAKLLYDILENESDIVISNIGHYIDGRKKVTNTIQHNRIIINNEKDKLLKWLLLDDAVDVKPEDTVSKTVWNVMFSRKLLENNDVQFERMIANEDDWLFLVRCVQVAKTVYLEKETLYYWRVHSSQTTQNPRYIPEYCSKRKKLRKIVDYMCNELKCTSEEKTKYNVRYCAIVLFIGVRNSANGFWNGKLQMSECVEELKELYQSLEKYLLNISIKNVLNTCKIEYGTANKVVVALVLRKRFRFAIILRGLWILKTNTIKEILKI